MTKKTIIATVFLLFISVFVFAGTPLEDEKKTFHPFIGERGGFNSLFVNPAGTAGQSGFELSINGGVDSSANDIDNILRLTELIEKTNGASRFSRSSTDTVSPRAGSGTYTMDELREIITDLQEKVGDIAPDNFDLNTQAGQDSLKQELGGLSVPIADAYSKGFIRDEDVQSMLDEAGIDKKETENKDWSKSSDVADVLKKLADPEDQTQESIDKVKENIEKLRTKVTKTITDSGADILTSLPSNIAVRALADFRTGFLINGFGLGIYGHATAVSYLKAAYPIDFGIETIHSEVGAVVGGGFNILDGKLALGFTVNYGILMRNSSPFEMGGFNTLIDGSINYGYSWGLDLGAIWRPTPALGVGIVFNDVFGYTQADMPYSIAGISGLLDNGDYLMNRFDYEFTMDIDTGVTWQPDWRVGEPKFSLDFYNIIGYSRAVAKSNDNFGDALYRSLEHIRLGANFTFFEFLNIGTQYYNHYISVGLGFELLIIELYGEFRIHEKTFGIANLGDAPIGVDLLLRFHF